MWLFQGTLDGSNSDHLTSFKCGRKACGVRTLVLLREMKPPVGVEVAARVECAQAQHRFGAREKPPCANAAHPVLDEMTTRTLDDPGRDRQAVGERAIVVEPARVLDLASDN